MRLDRRLRVLVLVELVLVGQLAAGCFAATAAHAATPSREARARAEVQRARNAFQRGQFEEALEGYANAYALDPRSPTLFNIAQCHRRLSNHEQAAFFFRKYLASHGEAAAPNQRQVERLIRELEAAHQSAVQAQRERDAAERARIEQVVREKQEAAARLEPGPATALAPRSGSDVDGRVLTQSPGAPGKQGRSSIFMKWWFWTGVGVVAAAAGTTAYVVSSPRARETTLGTQSLR